MFNQKSGRTDSREIHSGEFGKHSGSKVLMHNVLRQGYYWPTLRNGTERLVRTCEKCQKHATLIHQPEEELTATAEPWPFVQWGMDIVGLYRWYQVGPDLIYLALIISQNGGNASIHQHYRYRSGQVHLEQCIKQIYTSPYCSDS